jgi:catechol-2,3-dioxygenase
MTSNGISPTGLIGADLGVRDVAAAARFFGGIWNLSIVAEERGSVYLRGTGPHHHVLGLHPRPAAELLRVNLSASGRADVDALHARVAAAGPAAIEAPAEVREPGGGYAFAFRDPDGRVVRVLAGEARHADHAPVPDRPIGITHFVLNSPKQEAAAAFWVKALGFSVSDRSLLTFLRCNEEHHNIAFHPGPGDTLHHIAFEMPDLDSVMRGAGRMRDHGIAMEWGIGRHGPGNNIFAYFIGPEGFIVEYTAEVEKVGADHRPHDPSHWKYPNGHTDLWGITPPPSDRLKAAQAGIRFASGIFHP